MALPTINVGDAAIGIVTLVFLFFGRVWAFVYPVTFRPCGWLRGDGDC